MQFLLAPTEFGALRGKQKRVYQKADKIAPRFRDFNEQNSPLHQGVDDDAGAQDHRRTETREAE